MSAIYNLIRSIIHSFVPTGELDANAAIAAKNDAYYGRTGERLDPQRSIVDLLKLYGQDSSLKARIEMAEELGYTGAKNGSADMNNFLHEQVMDKVRRGDLS